MARPRAGKAARAIDPDTVARIERDLAYLETAAAKRSAIVFIRADGTFYVYRPPDDRPDHTTFEEGRWHVDGDEVVYEFTHEDGHKLDEPRTWRESRTVEYYATHLWLGEEAYRTYNERPDLTAPVPSGK